jgi:hypothetical protein
MVWEIMFCRRPYRPPIVNAGSNPPNVSGYLTGAAWGTSDQPVPFTPVERTPLHVQMPENGPPLLQSQQEDRRPLAESTSPIREIFLCHASEDKAAVVKPLAEALNKAGISNWLDAAELEWGDSITQKINEGLSKSALRNRSSKHEFS